jgi:hypothetical protein
LDMRGCIPVAVGGVKQGILLDGELQSWHSCMLGVCGLCLWNYLHWVIALCSAGFCTLFRVGISGLEPGSLLLQISPHMRVEYPSCFKTSPISGSSVKSFKAARCVESNTSPAFDWNT